MARGLAPITRASLLAWRQAGLLPPPRFRSLGRGRGSTQLWSTRSYRRLLQVSRLRGRGLAAHRRQRLHLWLQGNSADLSTIRRDLDATYRQLIRRAHVEVGAESWRWSAPDRHPSVQQAALLAGVLVQQVPPAASGILMRWGGQTAPLLTIEQALQQSAMVDLLRRWVRQLVVPEPTAFRRVLQQALAQLPDEWRSVLPPGLVDVVVAGVGLLADPAEGPQPLLDSLTACSDSTLLDLRDATVAWNDLWTGAVSLARALAGQDPTAILGPLAPAAGFLEPFLARLVRVRPVRTSEDALVLLAWLLLLHRRGALDSARLGRFARQQGGRRLFRWMAQHLEELQTAAGAPRGSLVGVPAVLPPTQQALWTLAYLE